MLSYNKYKETYFLLLLLIGFFSVKAQNIEIEISGIRLEEGQIIIGIYIDDESFQEENPFITKKFKKSDISKGKMIVKFGLNQGIYGFTLIDDENENGKIDYNFIGMPKEGFGFSNFYLSGLKKPKFDKFKFEVNEDQKQKIYMKIRYI